MFRVLRNRVQVGAAGPRPSSSGGLPLRWVVIGALTAAASVVAFAAGGPVAAIMAGAAVAGAAHNVID
jgi:hypothetical protein